MTRQGSNVRDIEYWRTRQGSYPRTPESRYFHSLLIMYGMTDCLIPRRLK
ncbi:MAG: hypothetical protein ACOZCF_10905 [Bacillota bacterium]